MEFRFKKSQFSVKSRFMESKQAVGGHLLKLRPYCTVLGVPPYVGQCQCKKEHKICFSIFILMKFLLKDFQAK